MQRECTVSRGKESKMKPQIIIFWFCVCISCGKEDGGVQRVLNDL
jgi:hypothetical protein